MKISAVNPTFWVYNSRGIIIPENMEIKFSFLFGLSFYAERSNKQQ